MGADFFKNWLYKKSSLLILRVVTALVLIGAAYYLGYQKGVENPETFVLEVANIESDEIKADFSIFWEAWKKLKEQHIEGDKLSEADFLYGAISGLTEALKDPNTIFLRADTGDAKKFEEDISGSFGGIGAEIAIRDNQLIIVAPLKNSPAERAGLRSRDKILKIDDFGTEGIEVNEAVKRIRGEISTKVALTVFRESFDEPKEFSVVREEIIVPTLEWEITSDKIAHIELFSFNEQAPLKFYEAAIDTLLKGSRGVVLDLRNNPGGFLEVAINLAGWFLDKGEIVATERFRDPTNDRIFRANGNSALKNLPVVILINGGSASASEILAGALRDHRNIKLIGDRSFGKGTVQELHPLKDGSKLKITVAHWVLPSGDIIADEVGLKPDVEVKLTEDDVKAEKEPQLDKALEILRQEIAARVSNS